MSLKQKLSLYSPFKFVKTRPSCTKLGRAMDVRRAKKKNECKEAKGAVDIPCLFHSSGSSFGVSGDSAPL